METTPNDLCTADVSVVRPLPFGSFTENYPPSQEIIQDESFAFTVDAPLVKFKVDNPFVDQADVYVQFYEGAYYNHICMKETGLSGCNALSTEITASCIVHCNADKPPSAVIDVYFVTQDASVFGNDVGIPECCYEETGRDTWKKVKYTYVIDCGCGPSETTRRLRGGGV
jgi:hypothetical protein